MAILLLEISKFFIVIFERSLLATPIPALSIFKFEISIILFSPALIPLSPISFIKTLLILTLLPEKSNPSLFELIIEILSIIPFEKSKSIASNLMLSK